MQELIGIAREDNNDLCGKKLAKVTTDMSSELAQRSRRMKKVEIFGVNQYPRYLEKF